MALRKLEDLGNYEDIDRLLKLSSLNADIEDKINANKKIIIFIAAAVLISFIFFPSDFRGLVWGISFIVLLTCYYGFLKKKQYDMFSEADTICMERYGDTFLNSLIDIDEDIKNYLSKKD